MPRRHERMGSKSVPFLGALAVVAACAVLLSPLSVTGGEAQDSQVSLMARSALPNLLIGEDEVPFPAVLAKLEAYPEKEPYRCQQVWSSQTVSEPGVLTVALRSLRLSVKIGESPERVWENVQWLRAAVAGPPEEVSQQEPFGSFSDRAWFGASHGYGGRLIFTRRNVLADIGMGDKEGLDPDQLIKIGAAVGRKIDAALAGRPEPPPALPPSAEEWGGTVEKAWKVREVRENLWGEDTTTIALQGSFPIPRAVSAKRLGFRDYLVPIASFRFILDKREFHLDTREGKVWVTTPDVQVALEEGKSFVKVGKVPVALSHPIESQNNVTTVPLSFAETVLGYDITWEDRADMPLARITAPERGE